MGKKKKKNQEHGSKEEENNKKDTGITFPDFTVVLKTDFHCNGCASKLIKYIRSSLDGVETAMIGEGNTIMVIGEVDPVELREAVEQKAGKKVELIWPILKPDGDGAKEVKNKKKESKDNKEITVTTAMMKVYLHCEGCIQKIQKTVKKTEGFKEMKIDTQKDLVMVTGAMDMKALAKLLQKQLKKDVEIVVPVKEGEKKEKGGGEGKKEGNKLQAPPVFAYPFPYPYPNPSSQPYPNMYGPGFVGDQFQYNPYVGGPYHAPQMFNDENPNACSIL